MIHLFPKLKNKILLLCACCIAMAGGHIALTHSVNPFIMLLMLVISPAAVVLSQLITAYNMHNQLLSKLYNQLDVDGFLRFYEPFLKLPLKNQNIYLMVRLHLSNAYCALGRFEEAEALLTAISIQEGKKPEDALLSRFAIVSNLCYFAQQQNNIADAKRYLTELLTLKNKLEALQQSKPEKKRMVFNTKLNEQIMKILTSEKADIEALRAMVQGNTQQLHKITISLWIARAYLTENNRREAETLLSRIVNLAPALYPGKQAAEILASLPAKES